MLLILSSCDDKRSKAEAAVTAYMKTKTSVYDSRGFGEFFEQTDSEGIERKLKTDKKIKYSLVHSFNSDKGPIDNMYFHLTKDLEVVGELADFEMTQIMMDKVGPKLDSIKAFLEDSLSKAYEEAERNTKTDSLQKK